VYKYKLRDVCKGCGSEVEAGIFHQKPCRVCEGKTLSPSHMFEREEYTCSTCGETWVWKADTGWVGSMGTTPKF